MVTMVSALKHIRTGDTNAAIEGLETSIDAGLAEIVATHEGNAAWVSTNAQFRIVGKYRLDRPHSMGDVTSDQRITDFLAKTLKGRGGKADVP